MAKVGFDDRKIVYYFLDDLERDDDAAEAHVSRLARLADVARRL